MNGNKGLGPDALSALILQAGGWAAAAEMVHTLILWIIGSWYVPVVLRGGKLVVFYKGKGSATDVDSYRGLLISDHIGKILTTLLQWELDAMYKVEVGE